MDKLESLDFIYSCYCTRKKTLGIPYPGTCRTVNNANQQPSSIRIKTDKVPVSIIDKLQGKYSQNLEEEIGDYIIKRADGYFAYHLATVIDDAEQNITEVVRGLDLLDSTPRQVYLQQKLKLSVPSYLHLPVAIDETGKKISKSDKASSATDKTVINILFNALNFLGFSPDEQLNTSNVETVLDWAIKNWDITKLPKEKEIIYTVD